MRNGHETIIMYGIHGTKPPESLSEVTQRHNGGGILLREDIQLAQKVLQEEVDLGMSKDQATKIIDLYNALPADDKQSLDKGTVQVTIDVGGNIFTKILPKPDFDANLRYL